MSVDKLMATAPTLMGSSTPQRRNKPAATGNSKVSVSFPKRDRNENVITMVVRRSEMRIKR